MSERGGTDPAPREPSVARALDLLNLLLIDVNGAIKPYLNVYLFVHRGWDDAAVGLVGTVSGIVGIAAQTPIGTAIDAVGDKRRILLGALVALSLATVLVAVAPHFWPVLAASCVLAAVGGMLSPTIATLTLGLFPAGKLPRRFGRNAALERTGNVAIAGLIGLVGWLFPDRAAAKGARPAGLPSGRTAVAHRMARSRRATSSRCSRSCRRCRRPMAACTRE